MKTEGKYSNAEGAIHKCKEPFTGLTIQADFPLQCSEGLKMLLNFLVFSSSKSPGVKRTQKPV